MFALRRHHQCLRQLNYFCSNNIRGSALHIASHRSSNRRLACYALGGLGTSAFAIFLYTRLQSRSTREFSLLSFTPATLVSSENISDNSKLIRLNLSPESIPTTHVHSPWAVYVKDSDIQVERPYTPLEGMSDSGDMIFWIKKYPHGEVGRWIHSKFAGDQVELRGPDQTCLWQEGLWDNVIMVSNTPPSSVDLVLADVSHQMLQIAGGTGLAPFYQLLHGVFSRKDSTVKSNFRLIHSHHSSELPPKFILKNLTSWAELYPEQLKVDTFVNSADSSVVKGMRQGRISKKSIESALNEVSRQPGKTIILVCGPESYVCKNCQHK